MVLDNSNKTALSEEQYLNIYNFVTEDYAGVYTKPNKMLLTLIPTFIVGACTAVLGIYSEVTSWLIIPALVVLLIWFFTLLKNYKAKRINCVLLFTYNSYLISICSLLCIYKLLHFAMIQVDTSVFISAIAIHLILPILWYRRTRNKLLSPIVLAQNHQTIGSLLAIGGLGYAIATIIGRMLRDHASNQTAVLIMVACMLFFSLGGAIGGTKFLLKYLFLRQYGDRLIRQGSER